MADYCNVCSKEIFGKDAKPQIDVYEIGGYLRQGYITPVLCEGCEMIGITKDATGTIILLYEEYGPDGKEIKKVPLNEWEKKGLLISNNDGVAPFIGGVQVGTPTDSFRLKFFKGIEGDNRFHVVKEFIDSKTTEYLYLSEEQILEKYSLKIRDKFDDLFREFFL